MVQTGREARLLPVEVPELGADRPAELHVVLGEERADRVLADQAREAELVVLGVGEHDWLHHRHRARRALVQRVTCPVVVVPPEVAPNPVPAVTTAEGGAR